MWIEIGLRYGAREREGEREREQMISDTYSSANHEIRSSTLENNSRIGTVSVIVHKSSQ